VADAVSLRTPRLLLREWRDDDLTAFAALLADPRVMEYLRPADSAAMARDIHSHFARHGFGFWAAELVGGSPFIGFIGLAVVGFEAPFAPAVQIGWWLSSAHWGRGYATEGAAAALDAAFGRLGLKEIVSYTVPANTRSQRVMQRLGMTHATDDDFDHPLLPAGHRLQPHVLYRIKRDEWRGLPRFQPGP
jgi:ribosomal-protein-alanine N-acetyltransferase